MMKMIDFANASLPDREGGRCVGEQTGRSGESERGGAEQAGEQAGPDTGFLMGLDNLRQILQSLLEERQFYL